MTTHRFLVAILATLTILFTAVVPAQAQGIDLAAQVRDKAALAVSQFQKRAGGRLDYSERSLAAVEELLAEASPYAKEMPSTDVKTIVELMGSYILEVGHRQHGGFYQWHEGRSQPVLVVGQPKFSVAIMTFDKVRGRLSGDKADNIVYFYQGFAARAQKATPGTNALYI